MSSFGEFLVRYIAELSLDKLYLVSFVCKLCFVRYICLVILDADFARFPINIQVKTN